MVVSNVCGLQKVSEIVYIFNLSYLTLSLRLSVLIDYQFLFVGSENGMLSIITDPEMRRKLASASAQKGPLLG
jgi:hypothetical protein